MVKKNFKRVLSILLCMMMILSTLPMSVFAEGEADTTGGSYDGGNWEASGTTSFTYYVDEEGNEVDKGTEGATPITLSKTAAPTDNENEYQITLQVQTSTVTTQRTDGGAVVLVIDVSGSMDYCAECGGESSHDDDCKYYSRGNNGVKTAQSRLAATKTAALAFLQSYAGTDSSANRQIALVKFSTTGSPVNFSNRWGGRVYWVNVAGGASGSNAANYTRVVNAINGLSASGGTNLDDGLYEAYNLLDDVNALEKNVIALTDGVPTYSRTSGDGKRGSATINSHTATQATNVKGTGANLYTVCFGVANEETYNGGPTVGVFLSGSVASSGCAYNADNTTELNNAFKAITENITSGLSGQGWTATDPMADKIDLVSAPSSSFVAGDNESYTWTLSDPVVSEEDANGVTTYTYTYTYRVKLDVQSVGFEEGTYYPTNKETYLNIDGQQYAFPVPGVQGKLPRTSVTVEKQWVDDSNRDKKQPESVMIQLKKDGNDLGDKVALNKDNDWTYTWTNLIEMSGGVKHNYTVVETPVEGYEVAYSNIDETGKIVVTNTHEIATKDITVTKVWDDGDNQDNKRPESITVHLWADGVEVASKEIKPENLNDEEEWTWTFTEMAVNKIDPNSTVAVPIVYTVTEDEVLGYNVDEEDPKIETVNGGFKITNTHAPEKVDIEVTKVWDDADNQDGLREEIEIQLYAGDEPVEGKVIKLDGDTLTGKFEGLDKYADGTEIVYTVDEVEVPDGYSKEVTGDATTGFTITNTHEPSVITIAGEKTWAGDNNDADGMRPERITVRLYANGTEIASKTVTAEDDWKWDFGKQPKFEAGKVGAEITYTVTEDTVDHYLSNVNGYNVENTYNNGYASISVTKKWDDSENQDGIRPNDVKVILLANGNETDESVVLNSGNKWSDSFKVLMKDAKGNDIAYTVKEVLPEGTKYEQTSIEGSEETGFIITNSYTPETTKVEGKKIWDDNKNQDGVRPESITINLLADGDVIKTVKVGEAEKWAWSFTDLPKYDEGTEIVYSVTEEAVEDYSATYSEEGYDVTNTHTPAQTSVTVTKAWEDNNDQDGIRPDEITVILLANDEASDKTLVLNADNKWTGSFTKLDKFENGEEIVYTVAELKVEGYETEITGDATKGFTITNTHEPEKTVVAGKKTWDDNNNQDGKRPEVIEINVFGNGVLLETVKVTEAEGWAWSFNLPKYVNGGKEVAYAITENAVEGYTATYEGYNVTNSYTPEETGFTVSKVWADSDDADGIRPDEVEIKLFANGEDTGIVLVLSEETKWVGSINGLPKYWEGEEIEYTVEEVAVKGYNTVIKGDVEKGFTVTNSHNYIPDTGDNRNPVLWISLMAGAVLTAGVALFTKKRKTAK